MIKALRGLYALIVAAVVAQTFAVPDAEKFLNPRLARIIFYHLPCALLATVFLSVGVYYALRYVSTKKWEYEVKSAAANELALILTILTLATGVLFSKVQWGAWWQWDPRQTSFLLVVLIFGAYAALRMGIEDPMRRAVASAAYCVASAIPSFFLIFVYPRLPTVENQSFHPSQTIVTGAFDRIYSITIVEVFAVLLVLALWAFRYAVKAALLEFQSETVHSAVVSTSGVVRIESVSVEEETRAGR
jgi:heme exporter protein C